MAVSKKVNHGKRRQKRSQYQLNEINANKRSAKRTLIKRICLHILFGLVFFFASALFSVSIWYKNTFDIGFGDLLFTLLSPLGGTGESTLSQIFSACAPLTAALSAIYIILSVILWKKTPKRRIIRIIGAVLCIVFLLSSCTYAVFAFKIPDYLKNTLSTSDIYETKYIDPSSVNITDEDGNAKNLIFIYLESMETTYASVDDGGEQAETNYMPMLTKLANENISFSDSDKLGGFRSISGTGWTMGALMGMTSGVPFSLAVFGDNSNNSQGKDGTFVNGLTALGDILADKGYTQEFLCGSDASFGGRKTYFKVHGGYGIFDYYTAIDEGYIAEDYKVWWGYEDEILFEIAKDELTELADGDAPFNFTMLTVDPHHVGGYKCGICGKEYGTKLENVIACQDNQVYKFVEWCQKQDFYKDTVIVIVGDHPRMDTQLIRDGLEIYDRTMYNCILNSAVAPASGTANRTFTSLDMFPTTLAAMGFEIEGDRLGLGTNVFSATPTLCEEYGEGRLGYDWLDSEVSMSSDYYKENFVNNKH